MSFVKLVQWAINDKGPLDRERTLAFEFLELCLELDPNKRISAAQGLEHPFLSCAEEDEYLEDEVSIA